MIPDFQTWRRSQPVPPGTKIRLESWGRAWWHGLEATIIKQDHDKLHLYHTTPFDAPGHPAQTLVHRNNFVVINP